jgi:hypothetical protein
MRGWSALPSSLQSSSSRRPRPSRGYDIDWLHIAAVLLLIPHHAARVFSWEEDFCIKHVPANVPAQRSIDFVAAWRMSLLFLLAGAASWLAPGTEGVDGTPASGSNAC